MCESNTHHQLSRPEVLTKRNASGRMVNRIVGPHGFVWKNSRVLPKSSSAATTPTGNKRARAPTAATKANTPSSKRRKTIDTPRDDEVISVDDDTDVPDEAVKLEDGADFRGDEYWASRQDEDWAAGFDEL